MQLSAFFKIVHNAHKYSKHYRNCPHNPVHIHIKAQQPNRGAEALQDKCGLQLPELQNNEDDGGGGGGVELECGFNLG
jgi:hypothetical protein